MNLSSMVTNRPGKVVLVLAIVGSIAWAAITHGEKYLSHLTRLHWSTVVAGLAICCVYRLCNAHGWWFVLRALRQRIPAVTALKLWLSSETCRWLPGSVWNFGSRALLSASAGVAPLAAVASPALELALTLAAWIVVAAACLPLCGPELSAKVSLHVPRLNNAPFVLMIGFASIVAGYVAWRMTRQRVARKFARLADLLSQLRQARPEPVRGLVAFCYYVLMNTANGAGLFCLILLMNRGVDIPIAAAVGANAIAWLVGFFALVAPGGLVVREGSLAVVLAAWMPLEQAVAVAVVWRVLQIGAELICMLIVFSPAAVHKLRNRSRVFVRTSPESVPVHKRC